MGYIYALLINIGIVGAQLGNKLAGQVISPLFVMGIRASIQFIVCITYLHKKGENFNIKKFEDFKLVMLRSSFSLMAMAIFMSSSQFIPIGIAITLFNTGPLMSFFIEALYLKKANIKWEHMLITLGCFVGIVFVVQPEFLFSTMKQTTNLQYIFYGLVLFSAFCFAMNLLYAHKIGKNVPFITTFASGFAFHCIGNNLIGTLTYDTMNSHKNYSQLQITSNQINKFIFGIALSTITGSAGQLSEIKSMEHSKPSVIMPFFYLSVIGGMIIDVLVFNSSYNLLMIIGALMTSLGLFCKFIIEKCQRQERK